MCYNFANVLQSKNGNFTGQLSSTVWGSTVALNVRSLELPQLFLDIVARPNRWSLWLNSRDDVWRWALWQSSQMKIKARLEVAEKNT